MIHTEGFYSQIVNDALQPDHLKGLLLGVIDGYRIAPAACKRAMDGPDRHDALGVIRRGKINEQLRGVADRFKIQYEDKSNSTNSTYFLSLFSGQLRLVAHLIGGRRHMVRPANIRKLWARHNHYILPALFGPEPEPVVPEDAHYVAFLIHGPRGRHRDQPAFAEIVVPDKHFRTYVCRLNLFSMFPEIANAITEKPRIQRTEPKPRRRIKEQNQGA